MLVSIERREKFVLRRAGAFFNEVFLLASILNPNATVNSFFSTAHLPSVLDRLAGA